MVTIDGMWRSPTTVGGLLFYFSEVLRITPESLKHSTISSYQQRTIISVEGLNLSVYTLPRPLATFNIGLFVVR